MSEEKKERPTLKNDLKSIVRGIHSFVSSANIQFEMNNFEVKKDDKNNVELSIQHKTAKTTAKISEGGNLSIAIKDNNQIT